MINSFNLATFSFFFLFFSFLQHSGPVSIRTPNPIPDSEERIRPGSDRQTAGSLRVNLLGKTGAVLPDTCVPVPERSVPSSAESAGKRYRDSGLPALQTPGHAPGRDDPRGVAARRPAGGQGRSRLPARTTTGSRNETSLCPKPTRCMKYKQYDLTQQYVSI